MLYKSHFQGVIPGDGFFLTVKNTQKQIDVFLQKVTKLLKEYTIYWLFMVECGILYITVIK